MSKSNYLENAVLNHVLGGPDFPRPATVFVALFTAAPGEAGGGTEVSGGSYARVGVTNNSTNFPNASGGVKSNGGDITFVAATGNWGLVNSFAIFDAASGGNMLYYGNLTVAKQVYTGDLVQFPAGQLTFTEE